MLYAKLSDGSLTTYDGMSQETVTELLSAQGLTATWLTQEEYRAALPPIDLGE